MSPARVLVYGGKGALGGSIVQHFKSKNFWIGSIDLFPNEDADANILVNPAASWTDQEQTISQQVEETLGGEKVDAILCVAGGWAGGNAASKELVKNADLMWKQSVWSSVIASHLAASHLKEGGALVLTGAHPAQKGTPGMIGYGMAKAAVHQLVKSLAAKDSGLPENSFVGAMLPVTLDTPMNRKFMPNADQSKWTPLSTIAELLDSWTRGESRPENGSLVQIVTSDGKTEFISA